MIERLILRTRDRIDFQNITGKVQDVVAASGVKSGVCHLFVPHTTAAITLNEDIDPNVVQDIARQLETLVPLMGTYHHIEGNASAHIKSSLVGPFLTLLVDESKLVLGTWQGIFLCEFDGPRERHVLIKVMPDAPLEVRPRPTRTRQPKKDQ